jgi:hypothetical protein
MYEIVFIRNRPYISLHDYGALFGLSVSTLHNRTQKRAWVSRLIGTQRFLDLHAAYAAEKQGGKIVLRTTFPEIDFTDEAK